MNNYSIAILLPISGKSLGKSALLALAVFGSAMLLVVFSNFFFAYSDMRMWVIAFRQVTRSQLLSWMCYLIFCFVFYYANSIVINTSRMRDMSAGKNLTLCAVINGAGIILFVLFNFIYLFARGHLIWNDFGRDYFLSVAVVFPMVVVLPLAAVYSRKLFEKTGSIYLGALVNAMIFTWIVVGNTATHYSFFLG